MRIKQSLLLTLCCLLPMWGIATGNADGQEFEAVERGLGMLVADGDLTLEQASVMLHALREYSHHRQREATNNGRDVDESRERNQVAQLLEHYERIGIDEAALDRIAHVLRESGFSKAQVPQSLSAIMRLIQIMRSSDKVFEMSEAMRLHFRNNLQLSDEQTAKLIGLAKRLNNANLSTANRPKTDRPKTDRPKADSSKADSSKADSDRRHDAAQKKILAGIDSLSKALQASVDRAELSVDEASKKWDLMKEKLLSPKIEAAVENGDLSQQQAEQIGNMIQEKESALRNSKPKDK